MSVRRDVKTPEERAEEWPALRAANFMHDRAPAECGRLVGALRLALQVIEQYQLDIRARGLDREGFCQGSYYRDACARLKAAEGSIT